AMQTLVSVNVGSKGWNGTVTPVASMRAIARTGANGLASHVTGILGNAADNAKVFKGIGSTLLFAAVAGVIVIFLITYRSPVLWLLPGISSGGALIAPPAGVFPLGGPTGAAGQPANRAP